MRNLWRKEDGTFDVKGTAEITRTIAEAILSADEDNRPIVFEFNGVTVTVRSDSNPELIYRDWSRALRGYTNETVGPYPNPILTEEEKARDARIQAESRAEEESLWRDLDELKRQYDEAVNARHKTYKDRLASIRKLTDQCLA